MKIIFSFLLFCFVLIGCKKDSISNIYIDEPDPPMAAFDTVTTSTQNFKGVNWADKNDNFSDNWLMLSGLSVTDNNDSILAKAEVILSGFQSQGANTVRLPVNPSTVLQNWWPNYSSIIGKATSKGMKVILAYWEGPSSKDGKVDNTTAFKLMWDRLVTKYINNQNIYFEVFNEPFGYNMDDLKVLYADWLTSYPAVPKRRIILGGGGYSTEVNAIGSDSRFNGCLLSFHYYSWFNGNYKTTADWENPLKNLAYPKRTIMTEFGVPMTDGKNYTGRPGYDNEITYLQGITSQLHDLGIGSMYWPGLRIGDGYSMFSYNGSSLTVNNTAGLSRLKYAWGSGTVDPFYANLTPGSYYKIVNRNSGKGVDVNGGSTSNGGNIIQWDYSGGNNQQWSFTSTSSNGHFVINNRNSNKALDVNGGSTNAGTRIIQWDYSGGNNQQWQITDIGFGYYKIINRNSNQSLDVNGGATWNGGDIIQWYWNNGNNQQWQIATP
jgi:endoglucanase